MRRKSRKILIAVLIGAFLMTAPVVVLFTVGYRYNWNKHKIEKTGILAVTSQPSDASVWLEGSDTGKTTPVSFSRLLPEDYAVRIEKNGYIPWEKTLSVRSGETTFAKAVTLFQDSLPTNIVDGDVSMSAFSPDAKRVALIVTQDEWAELRAFDFATSGSSLLARFGNGTYTDLSLDWSPDGAHVLLTGQHGDDGFTAIAFDADGAEGPRSVHDVTPKPAWSMRWSGEGDLLIAGTAAGLYGFRLTDEDEPVLLSPFATDGMVRNDDAVLVRRTPQHAVLEFGPAWVPAQRREAAYLPIGEYSVRSFHYPFAFVSDAKGEYWYADLETGRIVRVGRASEVLWERGQDPQRALLCSDFEIVILTLHAGGRELVTRLGAPVGNCDWSPDGDYIVYSSGGDISAIELDARNERNTAPLVRFTEVGSSRVDALSRTLWFTGAVGNQRGLFMRPL